MKSFSTYKYLIILLFIAISTACSVGNKVIPNPGGISGVDTSNTTLNAFQIIVTGDTSFIMSITSIDSLNGVYDDSLIVAGLELSGPTLAGGVGFKTFSSSTGDYLTEETPPGINTAQFGILKTIRGVRKIFFMNHGRISITEHNLADKTVKGSFDVNNEFNLTGDIYLRCRGNFYIKYQ
ncbi:MAG TPA: hypothetical protein PKK18_03290 [Chitinophagales bacterium]|nr:hypothetical protein [Chitinophagales bacterium]HMW11782.1 hypothetical protein [Chitinophagales bacterium]HMX59357.1 hypothetical protein [Chitinophagales bacterium]HMY23447.1 hypothetical protein [Chitinophagales bacterium]HMZ32701.1 hypothetical protein [Chitinophagales bacterium]